MVQIGATEHEIRTCLANLGTVHHQPEMLRFEMFATGLQTMVHRRLVADVMAAQAEPDTLLHFRIHVMHGSVPRLRWIWVDSQSMLHRDGLFRRASGNGLNLACVFA
jgi:hypothetical protein